MKQEDLTELSSARSSQPAFSPRSRNTWRNPTDNFDVAGSNEQTASGNRNHWRQRPLSDGGITRRDRTQDRHTIWAAVGHTRWRNIKRASGLLFAAARPRPSDSAARNKLSG